jgi:hypothetical protein
LTTEKTECGGYQIDFQSVALCDKNDGYDGFKGIVLQIDRPDDGGSKHL